MINFLKSYGVAFIAFIAIDLVWLSLIDIIWGATPGGLVSLLTWWIITRIG